MSQSPTRVFLPGVLQANNGTKFGLGAKKSLFFGQKQLPAGSKAHPAHAPEAPGSPGFPTCSWPGCGRGHCTGISWRRGRSSLRLETPAAGDPCGWRQVLCSGSRQRLCTRPPPPSSTECCEQRFSKRPGAETSVLGALAAGAWGKASTGSPL